MKSIPTNHKDALATLGKRDSLIVGNNTRLHRHPGDVVSLRLHSTDVVTWEPGNTVTVNSGGWRTLTTKDRINSALPSGFRLHQNRGLWYWNQGASILFTDGDKIRNGWLTAQAKKAGSKTERDALSLQKRIGKFATLCASKLPLKVPGPGDCFYCQAARSNPEFGGTGHLISHMEEGYIVPSLVLNALTEANQGDLIKAAAFGQSGTASWLDYARRDVKSAVRKYLKRRFNLAPR